MYGYKKNRSRQTKGGKASRGKKAYRKRYSRYGTKSTITRGITGPPDRFRCKLQYDRYIIVSTAGGTGYYQFRGNDLYDPDYTGVGGQPCYFDQLAALYLEWCVDASSCKVTMINDDTVTTFAALFPSADTTIPADQDAAAAVPRSKRCIMAYSGAGRKGFLKHYCKTKTIFGVRNTIDNEKLHGQQGSSPLTQWYWTLFLKNIDAGAVAVECYFKLTYYVTFFRKQYITDA